MTPARTATCQSRPDHPLTPPTTPSLAARLRAAVGPAPDRHLPRAVVRAFGDDLPGSILDRTSAACEPDGAEGGSRLALGSAPAAVPTRGSKFMGLACCCAQVRALREVPDPASLSGRDANEGSLRARRDRRKIGASPGLTTASRGNLGRELPS